MSVPPENFVFVYAYKVIVPVPHDYLDEVEKIESELGRGQKSVTYEELNVKY